MKHTIQYLLLTFLISFYSSQGQAKNHPYWEGIYLVAAGEQQGSAVAVGKEAGYVYFVTAYHVVQDELDNVMLSNRYGSQLSSFPVEVLHQDRGLDIAILRVKAPAFEGFKFKLRSIKNLKTGTRVSIAGFPGRRWLSLPAYDGNKIQDADQGLTDDYIIFSRQGMDHGCSGGALLKGNSRQLIGILARFQNGNKEKAIRIDRIIPYLMEWNVPMTYLTSDPVSKGLVASLLTGFGVSYLGWAKRQAAIEAIDAYEAVDLQDGTPGNLQENAIIPVGEIQLSKQEAEDMIAEDSLRQQQFFILAGGLAVLGGIWEAIASRKRKAVRKGLD